MKSLLNQKGFSAVEGVIILAVVVLLGIGGYLVFNRQDSSKNQTASEQSSEAKDVPSAPEISSKSDLDEAETALDQADPSASNADASQLDSELSAF